MAPPGASTTGIHAKNAVQGPPYRLNVQTLGEIPSVLPDAPINVVFFLLFSIACGGHAVLFSRSLKAGKKFPISAMVSGFCVTKLIATMLRLAWACNPANIHLAIGDTVSIYAGVILLFFANLLCAQRIVRAQHPRFGWSKPFTVPFPVVFIITIAAVLCLIVSTVVKFYTLDQRAIARASIGQRFGATWLAVVALLPVIITSISSLARRHPHIRATKTTDKFGEGSMRAKVIIVVVTGLLLCLGASFRAATILLPPVPITSLENPPKLVPEPWYLSKACFYVFNFTLEIIICYFWLFVRIDKRFYIPDGASGAFSYAGGFVFAGESGNEKKRLSTVPGSQRDSDQPRSLYSRDSRRGSRLSLASERSRQERVERQERRISWGGLSLEGVEPIYTEDRKQPIPYLSDTEDTTMAEVVADGVEKELGWDPQTGKWAVRPVVSVRRASSRPPSMASSRAPSMINE